MSVICGGFNASSQLGSIIGRLPPYKMNIPLDGLKCITSGEDHTVIVYDNGKAFALGDDEDFTIGTPNRTTYMTLEPINITDEKISYAHCGSYYSCYLTQSGKVIICSLNKKEEPVTYTHQNPIIHLNGSGLCPCAIDSNGGIIIFDSDPSKAPEYIKLPKPVFEVCRTDAFIACVTIDGEAYGNGILNNGKPEFARITALQDYKIKNVVGAEIHAIFITEENRAFIFSDIYNEEMEDIGFHEITDIKVSKAATGGTHAIFITPEGDLYCYGYNNDGALLIGNESEADPPQKIGIEGKAVSVVCGHLQSFVLIDGEPLAHPGASFFNKL